MPDIFLSYSREDQLTARWFAEGLEREGFSVWWDQALKPGEAFDQVTEQALEDARAVIVLWSKASVNSRWVRAEATQASAGNRLVPVMIEPCKRPIMFELTHTADLAHWRGEAGDPVWQAFVADLRGFAGKDAAPAATQSPALPATGIVRNGRVLAIFGAAAVLAAAAWGLWHQVGTPHATARQEARPATLAVLPFENLSSNTELGNFADGLRTEIQNGLGRIGDLHLNNSQAAAAAAGKSADVGYQLHGNVRESGGELRITVELVDARTGTSLWPRAWNRPYAAAKAFAIQEDISRQVSEAVQVTLGVGELGHQSGMTRDLDAYDAYRMAQAVYGAGLQEDTLRQEIGQLELATSHDAQFGQALAMLATTYAFAATMSLPGATPEEWKKKSVATFERARLVAPALFQGDAASDMAQVLTRGRFRDVIKQLQLAKTHGPLDAWSAELLSEALAATGDLPGALNEQERALQQGGETFSLRQTALFTALAAGKPDLISRRIDALAGDPIAARMKPLLGRPQQALQALRHELAQRPALNSVDVLEAALWAGYFHAPEAALEILHEHIGLLQFSPLQPAWWIWHPLLREARKQPAFRQLLIDLGMPALWQKYGYPDPEFCRPLDRGDFTCA